MNALLIVAHGSRRASSNEEIRLLAGSVAAHAHNGFDRVSCGFLELADPSIPEGLRELIREGAKQITVVPYFLSAGRHVVEDIPAEVTQVVAEYPDGNIRIAPYLGASSVMPGLLLAQGNVVD